MPCSVPPAPLPATRPPMRTPLCGSFLLLPALLLLLLMAARAHAQAPRAPCCSVLELRQYTLHPGKRDVLIELFEREFVESQEALGMQLVGQFRDADDPDRFVWLRGF